MYDNYAVNLETKKKGHHKIAKLIDNKMERANYWRNKLENSLVLLVSGYHNASKTDKTDQLADEFKQPDWLKYSPVILPSVGYWEGEQENSLAVILIKNTDRSFDVADITASYRKLLTKYNQQAGLLGRRGFYWAIGQDRSKDAPLGNSLLYGKQTSNLPGWTILYNDKGRTEELLRFAVDSSAQETALAA